MRAVSFVCKAQILLKAFSYLSRPVCLSLITQTGLQMKQTEEKKEKKTQSKATQTRAVHRGSQTLNTSDLIKKEKKKKKKTFQTNL